MIEAVLNTVGYCSLGKQRCPALADMFEDGILANDIQVGILLPRKGSCWQVLCGCTGAYCVSASFAEHAEAAADLFDDGLRDDGRFDRFANLAAELTNFIAVFQLQKCQLFKHFIERGGFCNDVLKGFSRNTKT